MLVRPPDQPIKPKVGMYYFGNWNMKTARYITEDGKINQWAGPNQMSHWVNNQTDRDEAAMHTPLGGWGSVGATTFNDEDPEQFKAEMNRIADAGVDFVTFAWVATSGNAHENLSWDGHPVRDRDLGAERFAQMDQSVKSRLKYSLMWETHASCRKQELDNPLCGPPRTVEQWDVIVKFWVENHLLDSQYLFQDGMPVVSIYRPEAFLIMSQIVFPDLTPHDAAKAMLDRARTKAREFSGGKLTGIYFVLLPTLANDVWVNQFSAAVGVDAISAYNYRTDLKKNYYHGYDQLMAAYQENWQSALTHTLAGRDGKTPIPYWVPVLAGWDNRPTLEPGDPGQSDPHNKSHSTPTTWRAHLQQAYDTVAANPIRTGGIVMAEAWNEYGEGSIIAPTEMWGTQYVDILKEVFSQPASTQPRLDVGTSAMIPASGKTVPISVTTNQASWKVTEVKKMGAGINGRPQWAEVNVPLHAQQTGTGFEVTVSGNPYNMSRAVTITVEAGNQVRTIWLVQDKDRVTPPPAGSWLASGQWLSTKGVHERVSPDQRSVLYMEDDGDVVLYHNGVKQWHLGTQGIAQLVLEYEGALKACLYATDGNACVDTSSIRNILWSAPGTWSQATWWLTVHNNGRVVLSGKDWQNLSTTYWDSHDPTKRVAVSDVALSATPRAGQAVTFTGGEVSAPRSIQWLLNGEPIKNANATTYTPQPSDQGKALSVEVTTEGPLDKGQFGEVKTSAPMSVKGDRPLHDVTGWLDAADDRIPGRLSVYGWALDGHHSGVPATAEIVVGETAGCAVGAGYPINVDIYRQGINDIYPLPEGTLTGFFQSFDVIQTGAQKATLCIEAPDGSWVARGTKEVVIKPLQSPQGWLDAVDDRTPGRLTVYGWALDGYRMGKPAIAKLMVGATPSCVVGDEYKLTVNAYRPDISNRYPLPEGALTGFYQSLDWIKDLTDQPHSALASNTLIERWSGARKVTLCVQAPDGSWVANGTKDVVIQPLRPVEGNLENAVAAGSGRIGVHGWAVDGYRLGTPATAKITVETTASCTAVGYPVTIQFEREEINKLFHLPEGTLSVFSQALDVTQTGAQKVTLCVQAPDGSWVAKGTKDVTLLP